MADVTLLRTLTRKSQLKYGGSFTNTVQDKLIEKPRHLVWDYFSLSAITFTEDVLDELGITPEMRIPKPGKISYAEAAQRTNSIMGQRLAKLKEEIGEHAYMKAFGQIKSQYRRKRKGIIKASRVTAGALAWKNQGHGG